MGYISVYLKSKEFNNYSKNLKKSLEFFEPFKGTFSLQHSAAASNAVLLNLFCICPFSYQRLVVSLVSDQCIASNVSVKMTKWLFFPSVEDDVLIDIQ